MIYSWIIRKMKKKMCRAHIDIKNIAQYRCRILRKLNTTNKFCIIFIISHCIMSAKIQRNNAGWLALGLSHNETIIKRPTRNYDFPGSIRKTSKRHRKKRSLTQRNFLYY